MWIGFKKVDPFHDSEGKFASADSGAWKEAGAFTAHKMALDKELKVRGAMATNIPEAQIAFREKMPIKEAADFTQKVRRGDY